jgi:hypothetical protein
LITEQRELLIQQHCTHLSLTGNTCCHNTWLMIHRGHARAVATPAAKQYAEPLRQRYSSLKKRLEL